MNEDNDDLNWENRVRSFIEALAGTKMLEIVETKHGLQEVHTILRVYREKERSFLAGPVKRILQLTQDKVDVFVGRQYILSENDELRQQFVLSLSGPRLEELLLVLEDNITSQNPKIEVEEAPLMGPSTPRGSVESGQKGARPVH